MSLTKGPRSAVESLTESTDFNFNSLSLDNAYQNIHLSPGSDQSGLCSTLQNQINDLRARNDHGLDPSFQKEEKNGGNEASGSTEYLTSDDDTSNLGVNLNARCADDDSEIAESTLSVGSSSNNINHSAGVSSMLGQQDDISSGSNFSNPGMHGQRREIQGGSRQVFEAGSSSGSRQVENILSNNLPAHLNASSSHALPMTPWSLSDVNHQEYPIPRADPHANFDTLPHPSTNIHPQWPQGNFSPGRDFRSRQNSMPFNSLATGNSPLHFDPNFYQLLMPHLPLTINANSRAVTSTERRQLSDQRDLSHHSRRHSLAVGSYSALDGASYHQRGHNSGFQQVPTLPFAYPSTNQAGRQQTALGYPPVFSSPWNGPGSGVRNFDLAPPYAATSGNLSLLDAVLQSGDTHFLDPLIPQSALHLGRAHALQSMAAQIESNHRALIELRDRTLSEELHRVMRDTHPISSMHAQALLQHPYNFAHHNAFQQHPGAILLQEMQRGMRVDVDQMSYEELLTLGEQIGSVRTGLREETIMELLKRRDHEYVTRGPSSDAETCCICREEYVRGEEIGGLNCGHEFHTGCIKQWLVIKNICPICTAKALGT